MDDALYMEDAYLKEWSTIVRSVSKDRFIVLDKTAFYPRGGGVAYDTGKIIRDDGTFFNVVFTGKFSGKISHEVDKAGLKMYNRVHCKLDWDRRYLLMRYHTAAHVLSGVLYKEHGLQVTGNQLTVEKGRIDVNMTEMNMDIISQSIDLSNIIIKKNLPVEIYYLSRDDAENDPDLVKLAMGLPSKINRIRIVDIKGFDRQADGGCHVRSLQEIGSIVFKKKASKGKKNKRIYFTVEK